MRTIWRSGVMTSAGALALVLAACGGDDSSGGGQAAIDAGATIDGGTPPLVDASPLDPDASPLAPDAAAAPDAGGAAVIPSGAIFANTPSQLWRVNAAATSATLVATFSGLQPDGVLDIAFSPEGVLYATTEEGLYTVDPATAVATLVGSTGTPFCNGLTWVESGDFLLCVSHQTGNAYRVNTTTGALTLIGLLDEGPYTSSGDVIDVPGLGTFVTLTIDFTAADELAPMNVGTGAVGEMHTTAQGVYGLAYTGTTLLGFTEDGDILTLAPNGTATVRGTVAATWYGATTRP